MIRLPLCLAFVCGVTCCIQIAAGQSLPDAALRQSVAIVVARGINENDSAPVESQATGFFINTMGLLVTSYHIRQNLGATVNAGSVNYEVHFDAFGPPVPATDVYSSAAADLLILYVPVSGRNIGVLKPADRKNAKIELSKTPVYAASFAAGYDFSLTPAVITAFSGPIRPLIPAWTTNVAFADGQSGSPLVLEDGRVIAIVKGADAGGGAIGIVVPIMFIPTQFWDSGSAAAMALSSLTGAADAERLVVTKAVTNDDPRQIVRSVSLTREACDPSQLKKVHIAASPGMTIEPGSVKLITRSFVGDALVNSGVSGVTPRGFDVNAEMAAAGVCVRGPDGTIRSPAARFDAELKYLERPTDAVAKNIVVAETPILPGVVLPVGLSTKGLSYTIVGADGIAREFVPKADAIKSVDGQMVVDLSRLPEH